jgi:steroid delta-isomerase-like uncharacterized protein
MRGMSNVNATTVRRIFDEALNGRRLDLLDELLSADYVNHDMPAPVPGPEGMRQVLGMFLAAFPDMRVQLHHVVADGDLVCTHGTFTGTQREEFMGVPASGNAVSIDYLDLWRMVDGKGAENWVRLDMLGLMQQIGALPTPA